jgi:hypothetical protein
LPDPVKRRVEDPLRGAGWRSSGPARDGPRGSANFGVWCAAGEVLIRSFEYTSADDPAALFDSSSGLRPMGG